MIAGLKADAAKDPAARLQVLQTLLDVCMQSLDAGCVQTTYEDYRRTGEAIAPRLNNVQKLELARRTFLYVDYLRLAEGSPESLKAVIENPIWKLEHPYDGELYLRRQVQLTNTLIERGDHPGAMRTIDKILSYIASLENPEEGGYWVANALVETIGNLVHLGDHERAWGVFLASGPLVDRGILPGTLDHAQAMLTAARLFQERGQLSEARRALDHAVAAARLAESEPPIGDWLLGEILTLRTVVCALASDLACARESIDAHPLASAFASARPPADYDEVTYLAARGLASAGQGDPVVAASLDEPVTFETRRIERGLVEIYRQAGAAVALPGDAPRRRELLRQTARHLAALLRRERSGAFGAWYRPGAVDQFIMLISLSAIGGDLEPADREAAFTLLQLLNRAGPSFDSDAQTLLGLTRDGAERRAFHEALRLRARRDQLERERLMAVSKQALAAKPAAAPLSYAANFRLVFSEFSSTLERAEAILPASGQTVAELADVQRALRPGEAAVLFAPSSGAVAHMCLRRDEVFVASTPVDMAQLLLDVRFIQNALTAGHAPSDSLDAQFPAQAAVRLEQTLIAPVADCLRPGDHLIWLSHPAMVPIPLTVLLKAIPPRTQGGYDLAKADWLVRRYDLTYAISASAFVAGRRGHRPQAWAFDFLGVGDPLLTGATPTGEARQEIVLRGARGVAGLSGLEALPETGRELERSARGFQRTRLLVRDRATEAQFRKELTGHYRFLSFATHGLVREELAGLAEPALVLTPTSAARPFDDGLLTASEIADLSLSARFVALSACNTANFDLTQFAADLPALASAFAVAGTPTTLATLWPVESETSARIVSAVFAGLAASAEGPPGRALAEAQRRYLDAPPSRPFLHPRFWAPFIVLGDGTHAEAARPQRSLSLETVQRLTSGVEVIGLRREGAATVARLIDEAESGRHASAVQVLDGKRGSAWRAADPDVGASSLIVTEGPVIVAGGGAAGPDGRYQPVVQWFDAADGRKIDEWRGSAPESSAFPVAGLPLGRGRGLFAVAEYDSEARPQALRVYEVGANSHPRALFDLALPAGVGLPDVTLAVLGDKLLVTYSARYYQQPARPPVLDDFDAGVCGPAPSAWAELRDLATGALLASKRLEGVQLGESLSLGDGVIVGGARQDGCGRRALVARLDAQLNLETWFEDASAGGSEVRALGLAPDRSVVFATFKSRRLDFPVSPERPSPVTVDPLAGFVAGMVGAVSGPGRAGEPLVLAAGGNVYLASIDASRPGDILVGGAVGGEAAIFHLRRN